MERRVTHRHLVAVTGCSGPLHRRVEGLDLREVGIGHPRHTEACREALQLGADLVRLEKLGGRRTAHAGAAERQDLHHAQRLEPAEGLANRCAGSSPAPARTRVSTIRESGG